MTEYGLTSTGFRRKTYAETIADIETWQRDKISKKLDLSEKTILGNTNAIVSEELTQAWETLEVAAGALDPDNAVEALLVGLCKLTGVVREGETYGHVTGVELTFSKATTILPGTLLLAVAGESTNLWSNDSAITALAAGTVTANFTSVGTGSTYAAGEDTLTVIATPIDGLVSATNPTDATAGTDQQSIDALRVAREDSLANRGKGTCAAIATEVSNVPGVIDVICTENDTTVTDGAGVPPGNVHVLLWDGPGLAASNTDIAQAIYTAKSAGGPTHGGTTAAATDARGASKYMHFDRATAVNIYVAVTVHGSVSADAVKAAVLASHGQFIGRDVAFAAIVANVFNTSGVTAVGSVYIGAGPGPTTPSDYVINDTQVGVLDASRIAVTIAA